MDYNSGQTLRTHYKTHPGRQEWVSLVECIYADGRAIPPLLIFKADKVNSNWITPEIPEHWCMVVSESVLVKVIRADTRTAAALTQNMVKRKPGRLKKSPNTNKEDLPISFNAEESETDDRIVVI